MLDQIPRPLLVFGALLLGIGLIFLIQEPHSICNAQLDVLKEAQAGQIFTRQTEKSQRPAIFPRLVENCKIGNSPGACYEMFTSLRKLIRDLNGSPQECLAEFGEVDEIKRALHQGTELVIQLAWGDRPPEPGVNRFGWMEAPDLSLYCQLKSVYLKTYGNEGWESFRLATYAKLPGEAQIIEQGKCTNCESLKKATDAFSAEEIWIRSLFSLRCDQYL